MSVPMEIRQSERPGAAHLARQTVVNDFTAQIELPYARADGQTILVIRRADQQNGSAVLHPRDDTRLVTRDRLRELRDIRGFEAAFAVVQKNTQPSAPSAADDQVLP